MKNRQVVVQHRFEKRYKGLSHAEVSADIYLTMERLKEKDPNALFDVYTRSPDKGKNVIDVFYKWDEEEVI